MVQILILIAILHTQEIIQEKESTLMKKFLLTSTESKANEILKSFFRKKSLYQLRSELRGRMGLPRMQNKDINISTSSLPMRNSRKPPRLISPQSAQGRAHKTSKGYLKVGIKQPMLTPAKSHQNDTGKMAFDDEDFQSAASHVDNFPKT